MKMIEGDTAIDFYFFWRWQYIRRCRKLGKSRILDFNEYAFDYMRCLAKFEDNNPNTISSDMIIKQIAANNFRYVYPACIEYESIIVLDSSYLSEQPNGQYNNSKEDIDLYNDFIKYIEESSYLVSIKKNSNIDTVLADISFLIDNKSKSREEFFIKSRGISIEDFQKPTRDKARAVGLWLWDRADELGGHRGTIKRAIEDFNKYYLEELELINIEETDLRFYRRQTDKCIMSEEVLPFTKRGTRK